DLQSGANWDFNDYMHMEAHSLPDQQGEPASPSSHCSVAQEHEEPTPVAGSSRATKNTQKAKTSPTKASTKGSPPKQPVQCDWEGCGRRFPRLTELNKHVKKDHLPPSIPCKARDAATFLGMPPCEMMFYENKDMYRHIRNAHPFFAADPTNGISPEGGHCPVCGEWVARDDNLKRHIDEQHKDMQRGGSPTGWVTDISGRSFCFCLLFRSAFGALGLFALLCLSKCVWFGFSCNSPFLVLDRLVRGITVVLVVNSSFARL
ncbi:uncharacterized protein LY79DRAFT_510080, partial [Colletotrichum navitas]